MGLDKKTVAVNFGGLDQKTDPKQVAVGKMLSIVNAVFTKTHQLLKRFGYQPFSKVADNLAGVISTGLSIYGFGDETLIQDQSGVLYSYSNTQSKWITKGTAANFDFDTTSIIYDNYPKFYQDTAYDSVTGYQIFVYSDNTAISNNYYTIIEKATGNIIVKKQTLTLVGISKVFLLGTNFIVITISTNGNIYYNPIACATLAASVPSILASGVNTTSLFFDGVVIGTNLYVSVLKVTSNNIETYRITNSLVVALRFTYASVATISSLCIAGYVNTNIFIFYGTVNSTSSVVAGYRYNDSANTSNGLYSSTTAIPVYNLGGYVDSTSTFYYVMYLDGTNNGCYTGGFSSAGTSLAFGYSVLGSKPISKLFSYLGGLYYFCCPLPTTYYDTLGQISVSTDQQTIYLINFSYSVGGGTFSIGQVFAKLEVGYAYLHDNTSCLPEVVQYSDSSYTYMLFAYLKKSTPNSSLGGISYNSGINSTSIFLTKEKTQRKLLGKNLNFGGGQTYAYDSENVFENNFNTYPEIIDLPFGSVGGAIGTGTSVANSINKLSYVALYEWVDNQGQKHRSTQSIPAIVSVFNPDDAGLGGYNGANTTYTTVSGSPNVTTTIPFDTFVKYFVGGYDYAFSGFTGNVRINSVSRRYSGGYYYADFVANVNATSSVTSLLPNSFSFTPITSTITTVANSKTVTAAIGALQVGQRLTRAAGTSITNGTMVVESLGNGIYVMDAVATAATSSTYYSKDNFSYFLKISNLALTYKQNVNVTLYRTTVNGTVYYKCLDTISLTYSSQTSRYVTITDVISDYALVAREQLYTTGGEVENVAPPAPEILITYKNRLLNVPKENKLCFWYSKQIISGFPVEFSDSFIQQITENGGDITALGVLDEKLIIFKNSKIFYMLGDGPSPNGTNNDFTAAQLISSDVGCTDRNSLANTADGLFFQSQKGIYILDRSLNPQYIGAPVETYGTQEIVSTQILLQQNQVRFALVSGTTICYDTFQKQWSVFASTGDSLTEVDSEVINDIYYSINTDGVVKKETLNQYSDYRTVAGVQTQTYIPLSFDTSWFSLATIEGYERAYELILLGNYVTNHTLSVQIYYDFNESYFDTVTINDAIPSGAPDVFTYRMFMPRQKCTSFRFKITEVPVATYFGEGLKISTMTLRVGAKSGLNKIGASNSYGGA